MNRWVKVVLSLAIAVIVAALGFLGGFTTARLAPSSSIAATPLAPAQSDLSKHVDEVNAMLRKEALKPPSETSATAGAVQGLIGATGDKYAMYFDKRHFKYFSEDMAGEFGGIGVLLGEKDGTTYVVKVYDGTPAEKAGVKSGDLFSVIGGVRRDRWTNNEVVKRVRGKEGTKVTLTMVRPGKKGTPGKEYTVDVTRAMIQLPNIESSLKPGKVGYIRLGQFNEQATSDITAEIEKLTKQGATSFVLDLRDNPGGSLNQAVSVSSLFVDSGVIVRVDERGKPEIEYRTVGKKITDAPLVVLINGNSASASEIVGGALQDYKRAVLVGEKSFGKGSVQTVKELSWGGAVKFTIAHYLTPLKRVIDGKGLKPDVVVKMDPQKQANAKTDTQLQRALEEARKQ